MSQEVANAEKLEELAKRVQQLRSRERAAAPMRRAGIQRSIRSLKAQIKILKANPGLEYSVVELASLHDAISTMALPELRKTPVKHHSLLWLGRNMALHNRGHERLDEARGILGRLGVGFVL